MQRYRNTPEMQLKKTFYCFRTHLKYQKKIRAMRLCVVRPEGGSNTGAEKTSLIFWIIKIII